MKIINFSGGVLRLLDQRLLPEKTEFYEAADSDAAAYSIADMVVRGAPAIGIAGAYGYLLGYLENNESGGSALNDRMAAVKEKLYRTRPTAVNLGWALDRMERRLRNVSPGGDAAAELLAEAELMHTLQYEADIKLSGYGAELLSSGGKTAVLTHCNAGALATGGWGTALGVIKTAFEREYLEMVYAGETRPRQQGARLTCYELKQAGIPYRLISDTMPGYLMQQGMIGAVIVGADRIAANGDTANKIGTYQLAVLARRHGIPFYVAAPVSTFDFYTPSGAGIRIEMRPQDEILKIGREVIAPEGTAAFNPAFDVTPKELVSAFITEKGIIREPNELQ